MSKTPVDTARPAATQARVAWYRRSEVRTDALYIGLIVLLVVVLFSPFIFSDKVLYGSDTLSSLDGRVFLRDAMVKDGQFPTWFNARLGACPLWTPHLAMPCIRRQCCSTGLCRFIGRWAGRSFCT